MAERFSLVDLPDDCLFLIFQQVPFMHILKLKRVCLRLFKMVNKYLQTHAFSLNYDEDNFPLYRKFIRLEKLFSVCPKLSGLRLHNYRCSITDQIANVNPMNQMRELQLHLYILKPTLFQFETLLAKCPNLEILVLNEFHFYPEDEFEFELNSSSLRCLELISVNLYSFEYIITKLSNQLTSLTAEFFDLRTSLDLMNVVKCINEKCSTLKELNLFVSYVDGPLECLPNLPNIEKLKLEFTDHIVPISCIEDLLISSPRLKSLHLFFRSSLSHDQILELCSRYCRSLENLNNHFVLGNTKMTETGLMYWKRMEHLKYFLNQDYDFWKASCQKGGEGEGKEDNQENQDEDEEEEEED